MSQLDTELEIETRAQVDEPGDHEKLAHIVDVRVCDPTDALVNGKEVQALCGKRWVPTRDPKRYPVCPTCKGIWDEMDAIWRAEGR